MIGRVAVVGATGFVGTAVVERLRHRGVEAFGVAAPRVSGTLGAAAPSDAAVTAVVDTIAGAACVVNAAGLAEATAGGHAELDGANGLMPGLLARACSRLGVRLVHVSSAAVQGGLPLDSSQRYAPFSPYSRSKVIGEQSVLAIPGEVCVVRPPGVHSPTRSVTRSIMALARSPFSTVAAPGTDNAPQAQLVNVADAIAFLAVHDGPAPRIIHLPAEGITTTDLLTFLGDRPPLAVPRFLARAAVTAARSLGTVSGGLAGHARRLDVLWFGQPQAHSWLTDAGWAPPMGIEGWRHMTAAPDRQDHR